MSSDNGRPRVLGGRKAPSNAPVASPLPSALDGRHYVIRDSGGPTGPAYVSRPTHGTGSGSMQVPLGNSEGERRVRLHEMAHVRWTPISAATMLPAGTTFETLNAVEDGRIHKRLREIGFGELLNAPLFDSGEWQRWVDSFEAHADPDNPANPWPPIEIARMHCASKGTHEGRRYVAEAERYGHGWVIQMTELLWKEHFGGRRPSFKKAVAFAEQLDALFRQVEESMTDDVKENIEEYAERDKGSERWGVMEIRKMPLTERLPRAMRKRVRRATDTGLVPRNWERLPIDRAVFTRKRYKPAGGTVLIDQSGSMHLDPEEVQALIAAFPAVTIATYAGVGEIGQLRIIAEGGVRASDEDCFHPMKGNIVDGPALEWLADHSEPRIWISDGRVTGANEGRSPELLLDVGRIVRGANIQRVSRLGELLDEGE